MIFNQTYLKVVDNTGVKKAQCIKIYKKKSATIGDCILISVKKIKKTEKKKKINIEKSNKFKAIVVRVKKQIKNKINNFLNFYENSIIIINSKNEPLGTKILGPIPILLRKKKLFKLVLIATYLV